jgi:hypothetical protein
MDQAAIQYRRNLDAEKQPRAGGYPSQHSADGPAPFLLAVLLALRHWQHHDEFRDGVRAAI